MTAWYRWRDSPGRSLSQRAVRCLVASLCAGLLPVSACNSGAADFAAHPALTRYDWGVRFSSSNPPISFPLPKGWQFAPRGSGGTGPNTVRLTSADGACLLLLTRAEATQSAAATRDALGLALQKDGHRVTPVGSQQVGDQRAQRLDAEFGKGLREQIFTMQAGAWLLTLTTVHSPRCRTTFEDTLTGLRTGS